MGKSHDLATLKDDGGTFKSSLVIDTGTNGTPNIDFKHANSSADQFRLQAGTPAVTNGGFSIYDIDAAQTRLNIDASGRVTMPYQPVFDGVLNTPSDMTGSVKITNIGVRVNLGSHWSSGRFTCPVAGYYHVHLNFLTYSSGNNGGGIYLYKNGAQAGRGYTNAGYSHQPIVLNRYIYCAAGDYLEAWTEGSLYLWGHSNLNYSVGDFTIRLAG